MVKGYYFLQRTFGVKALTFSALLILSCLTTFSQCPPAIIIDGKTTQTSEKSGFKLPYWLKEGQSLASGQQVNSISVAEYTLSELKMEFSKVIAVNNITSFVPQGKIWKIESIATAMDSYNGDPIVIIYDEPGTYNFSLPCIVKARIQCWGSGAGGSTSEKGAGGGGAAYSEEFILLQAGITYKLVIGKGGEAGQNGESTSFGDILLSNGGENAFNTTPGIGGTGRGQITMPGSKGFVYKRGTHAMGGDSPNGGKGGYGSTSPYVVGGTGEQPGGGGGGGFGQSKGGLGGDGMIKIHLIY